MNVSRNHVKERLELATNIVVIIAACAVGFVVVRDYLFRPKLPSPYHLTQIKPGTRLGGLNEVDWSRHSRTLLLVLKQGCHFCQASLPFYQSLIRMQQSSHADLGLVAVFPDTDEVVGQAVRTEGLNIEAIANIPLKKLGVYGTPTLILVDRGGKVVNSWVGELDTEGQKEVLKAVGLGSEGQNL